MSQGGPDLEGRPGTAGRAARTNIGVDPFGLELDFTKAAIAPALWLYRTYFRVQTTASSRSRPAG